MGDIKVTATSKYDTKETFMPVLSPKIISVTWVNSAKKKIDKVKYGVKACLQTDTKNSSEHCMLFVVVHCDNWKQDYMKMLEITAKYTIPMAGKQEQTFFEFIPKIEWLKNPNESLSNISAKIYMVSKPIFYPPAPDSELYAMAEAFKRNDTDHRCFSMPFRNIYVIMDEKETEKLSLSKLVIVIDPGHGVSLGNVGTQARKYKYKQQSDDGKEKKDKSGNVLTSISNVETIPQYVIDDPTKWVVGTIEDQKLDSDRTESFYVYDISQIMKELLKSKGYTIIITRTIRNVVSGYTIKTAISFRNDIANNNKADYFISLHYDGATNFNDCGSHAIYNSKNITDKVFADTILKYYTVVEKMSKHPNARTDLGVLETGNKTKYKTLIELGFISSLKDAKAMYANKNLIAQQIIQGLEEHIDRYFEL